MSSAGWDALERARQWKARESLYRIKSYGGYGSGYLLWPGEVESDPTPPELEEFHVVAYSQSWDDYRSKAKFDEFTIVARSDGTELRVPPDWIEPINEEEGDQMTIGDTWGKIGDRCRLNAVSPHFFPYHIRTGIVFDNKINNNVDLVIADNKIVRSSDEPSIRCRLANGGTVDGQSEFLIWLSRLKLVPNGRQVGDVLEIVDCSSFTPYTGPGQDTAMKEADGSYLVIPAGTQVTVLDPSILQCGSKMKDSIKVRINDPTVCEKIGRSEVYIWCKRLREVPDNRIATFEPVKKKPASKKKEKKLIDLSDRFAEWDKLEPESRLHAAILSIKGHEKKHKWTLTSDNTFSQDDKFIKLSDLPIDEQYERIVSAISDIFSGETNDYLKRAIAELRTKRIIAGVEAVRAIAEAAGVQRDIQMTLSDKIKDGAAQAFEVVKDDAADAAWRTAGSQFVKLTRDPLVALLQRHLGSDVETKLKITLFLQSEIGTSLVAAVLSMGLSTLPASAGPYPARLARELRVKAMADVGDLVAEVIMGPFRQVMTLYVSDLGTAVEQVAPKQLSPSISSVIDTDIGVRDAVSVGKGSK